MESKEELIAQVEDALKKEGIDPSKYPERFVLERKNIGRYLQGWDWDVKKATRMLMETIDWYKEYQPHKKIRAKDLESHLRVGKNYHNGFDKEGRPIIYMRSGLDSPGDHLTKVKLMMYQMERAFRLIEQHNTGADQVVWLVDMTGFNWTTSIEMGAFMKLKDALSNHYPERLGVLLIVNAPWIFSSFWKMISPLLAKSTVKKIIFVSQKNPAEVLSQYIDLKTLEVPYGGENTYKFDFDSYFQNLQKEEEIWEKQLEN